VHYGVLAPIGSPDMEPLGVAYVTWSADQALNPLVGAWPVPTQSAETYLVRRDGDSVRFLTPLRFNRDAALVLGLPVASPDMPAARAARGERGIIEGGRDYRRAPVLAYAAAVAGTPWLMIAEIDEAEAYAGVRTIAWATTILAGLGLTFVYSGGYLLWRRSRQRHELAALQAERAAEARFRVVFEQAPLGIALLDPGSGRFTDANPRLCEILGRSPRSSPASAPSASPTRTTSPRAPECWPASRAARSRATASTSATCARTARWCGPASPARRCAWPPRRPRATSTSSRTSPPAVRWRSSCASARRATA
jgi:PAS domain-containing protein